MNKKTLSLKKIIQKKAIILPILIFIFLVGLNTFLYKIFSARALSFGCFDDCANYMAGYFMLNGKVLYSEIFFNHIMGMAWISYFIQLFHNSINIYDLVLTHRQVIMLIAFILDFLIILRFRWVGLLFVLFYELTKFYVFGDRFLGESIAVYPSVYLLGLVWEKLNRARLTTLDYCFAGIGAWLIMVLREPYIPLALLLYGIILFGRFKREQFVSVGIFLLLLGVVFVNTSFSDFIFNDFIVNSSTAIQTETNSKNLFGVGIFNIFFYPLFIFIYGKWNLFRVNEIFLSLSFLLGVVVLIKDRKWLTAFLLVFILGLANIRYTSPGHIYFEAYQQMVWYGMFLFVTLLLTFYTIQKRKLIGGIAASFVAVGWLIAVFGPASYIYDKPDLQEQLLTNFGTVMNVGTVVNNLSKPGDTIFLDGTDDIIIWQSKLPTSYQYSWYTGVMPLIPLYREARIKMFTENPPDFYYGYCSSVAPLHTDLPSSIKNEYQRLYSGGNPSCLYIHRKKILSITNEQWEQAKKSFFELPESKKIP